jgi:hypothetical protein
LSCLSRQLGGLILRNPAALLSHEKRERMLLRESTHLLETLHRYEGRKRFPLSLDDELVLAQRDTVQQVADAVTDLDGRYSLCHLLHLHQLL